MNLSADNALAREAAVARLTVIGARAVGRLIVAAESAAPGGRVAAFRALEAIADPRALDVAIHATDAADSSIAAAAIGVARMFIRGPRGASVVDALTGIALARNRPESVRLAALRSLMDLERPTIAPLLAALASDPNAAIQREAALQSDPRGRAAQIIDPIDEVMRAAEHKLPDDASALHAAVVSAGDTVALPALLSIIVRVREREASDTPPRRMAWMRVRASAHAALARRGSRIAIYDLRESLDSSSDLLPVEFLSALSLVGDASCLEAIAAAYTRSNETWCRDHLTDAFRAIVAREKLTRRHAVLKRIAKRWPSVISAMANG